MLTAAEAGELLHPIARAGDARSEQGAIVRLSDRDQQRVSAEGMEALVDGSK